MKNLMKKLNGLFAHDKQNLFGGAAIIALLIDCIISYFVTGGYIFLRFGWRYVAIAFGLALVLALAEQAFCKEYETKDRVLMVAARLILGTATAGVIALLSQLF